MDRKTSIVLSGKEAGVYLRKSRVEEGLDTAEVLSKHEKALTDYAREHNIHIIETYPEVVSGESLYARPQMLRLLEDVEDGKYDCILCMDLDRLSRGRMKDQGIILDAFKDSGTLIVTPDKVYDLSDEIDEEYAELKTFMSRREYKIITKRLRRGLQQSIEAGCYVANAPYGYHKVTIDRKPTLEIYEPEARFVRMMYQLYAQGIGCDTIAHQINALGAHPHRSAQFNRSSVLKILNNPTYIGKIVWNQKKHIKKGTKGNNKHITIYQPKDKWTITDGLHPAIVDKELYDQVQNILGGKYRPSKHDGTVRNPLGGLVKCGNCGMNMQRMVQKSVPYLLCTRRGCICSTQFPLVEVRVLSYLEDTLDDITLSNAGEIRNNVTDIHEVALASTQKELAAAMRQKNRLYELLELGEYDLPTFRERMAVVRDKISGLERRLEGAQRALDGARATDPSQLAERIQAVLDAYTDSDAAGRNALLRTVIDRITYHKDKKTRANDFTLDITLKMV